VKILRHKLLLIALACTAPVVLASLAYFYGWAPGEAGNYGELIEPRALSGPPFDALRGKWVLVSFDAPQCDAWCEKKLYYLRQVRRAQGKNMERIERLWVLTSHGAPRPELLQAFEGTRVSVMQPPATSFPGHAIDHIYVVDPLGNLMMRYPRDADPSRMRKDLERLLRYSRVG